MLTGLSESGIFKLWQDRMAAKLSMEGIPDEFFAEINQKMDAIDGRWVKYKESVFAEWEEAKEMIKNGVSRKDIAVNHPKLRHVLSSAISDIEPLSIAYDEFCKYNG